MDPNLKSSDSLKQSAVDAETDSNSNIEECGQSCSSSDSYQSLNEQVNSLNLDHPDFIKPESMNHNNSSTSSNIPKFSPEGSGDGELGSEEKDKQIDKYFIDEAYLKTLEINMSTEENERRRECAVSLKTEGNENFKASLYEDASRLYTQGLNTCPLQYIKDRAVLYANRAASRSKIDEENERKGAIEDCSKAIELDSTYLKAIQRRANLNQQLGNLDEALKDFEKVLEIEPYNEEARRAKMFLPQQIEERNEKLKAEMMGKLKDLGNMILKPFGLSTNNFQLNKNEDTGGYNVNFTQNP